MLKQWLITLVLIPLLTACVTSKTFDAKEAELLATKDELKASQVLAKSNLDAAYATRDELKACQAQAQTDMARAMEVRVKTERELGETRRDLELCNKITDGARKYTEVLKAREENLREKLKTEVASKEVEISRLQDKLSVRVLDRILFKSGRADILPEGTKVLDKLIAVLATTDDMVRVEGHTDSEPIGAQLKQKYFSNWELSSARASSVVRYFETGYQIQPTRMEAVGFSKYHPVALGDSAEDMKRNRRVEIVLTAPRTVEPITDTEQGAQ